LDYFVVLFKMEYYDLSLNDLNLIRHLRKSRETLLDLRITRIKKRSKSGDFADGQGLWLWLNRSGSLRARIATISYMRDFFTYPSDRGAIINGQTSMSIKYDDKPCEIF
jgi:hypothetical protein